MGEIQHRWSAPEKLEVVRAYQKGARVKDLESLFHVTGRSVYRWTNAYRKKGLHGLEGTSIRRPRPLRPKTVLAGKIIAQLPPGEISVGRARAFLHRFAFLNLARDTVRRVLRRGGRPPIKLQTRRNKPPKIHRFEMSRPNQLWQADIMTFMLRGAYRLYVIGFIDDYSRFIVGIGVYRFQTADHVLEVFRAAIEKYGLPKEVLTDNGRQFYTWRGKGKFSKLLLKLGIRQFMSQPHHPQTLGKIEAFWHTLERECLMKEPVCSFEDAERKIKEFVERYNFRRPNGGIKDSIPADRFFEVDAQVRRLAEENTKKVDSAKTPPPEYHAPTYLVGNIGGKELRVVAKEAEVELRENGEDAGGSHEKDRGADGKAADGPGAPGAGAHGAGEGSGGGGALRGGGDFAQPVLPVAGPGAPGADRGPGDQEARPQGEIDHRKPEGGGGAARPAAGA